MTTIKAKRGQTMIEYIIIVALIAITLIGVFTYFGKATANKVAGAAAAIDDEQGGNARAAAEAIEDPDEVKSIKELK